ncbi:hypothetical protein BpHYR1_040700 [Brachionus plicatilis]|uniref:Uncharacterized protein n=1 Tax=Brachionus plicatilis TaxID=10195 RepID=A0A3M7QCU5_BRAPC|nr:hypothetical protein BpHYR1_040700 [Brachionus plicatilis]
MRGNILIMKNTINFFKIINQITVAKLNADFLFQCDSEIISSMELISTTPNEVKKPRISDSGEGCFKALGNVLRASSNGFYFKPDLGKSHQVKVKSNAISYVNSNKLNRSQAANGIPRHLLINHLIGRYKSTYVGRTTVYSTQEEEVISHMLQKMADWRYAINKDGLKEIVKNYAESLGKSDRFNNRQPKIPNFILQTLVNPFQQRIVNLL